MLKKLLKKLLREALEEIFEEWYMRWEYRLIKRWGEDWEKEDWPPPPPPPPPPWFLPIIPRSIERRLEKSAEEIETCSYRLFEAIDKIERIERFAASWSNEVTCSEKEKIKDIQEKVSQVYKLIEEIKNILVSNKK